MSGHLKSKFLFGGLNLESSRSFDNHKLAASPTTSLSTDLANFNSNAFPEDLQHKIRFASLGLAAQNIIRELFVRRIANFMRFLKITKFIW